MTVQISGSYHRLIELPAEWSFMCFVSTKATAMF
jgi:hypothetical protein